MYFSRALEIGRFPSQIKFSATFSISVYLDVISLYLPLPHYSLYLALSLPLSLKIFDPLCVPHLPSNACLSIYAYFPISAHSPI